MFIVKPSRYYTIEWAQGELKPMKHPSNKGTPRDKVYIDVQAKKSEISLCYAVLHRGTETTICPFIPKGFHNHQGNEYIKHVATIPVPIGYGQFWVVEFTILELIT